MFGNFVRQKKINDKTFQIYLLPTGKGLKTAKTLAQTFLPMWGEFMSSMQRGELDYHMLAMSLAAELESFEVETLIRDLLKELSVDGQEVKFDEYFMGNYGELVEVVAFAIKENFSSFFAAKGLFESLLPKVQHEATQAE